MRGSARRFSPLLAVIIGGVVAGHALAQSRDGGMVLETDLEGGGLIFIPTTADPSTVHRNRACGVFHVREGETVSLSANASGQIVTLDVVASVMCDFRQGTPLRARMTATATSSEPGRAAFLTISTPGAYSVQVLAPDAPAATRALITLTRRPPRPAQ